VYVNTSTKTAFSHIEEQYRQQYGTAERFSANRTFDKLAGLTLTALVCGVVGYFAVPGPSAFGFMAVAFVLVVVSWFRIQWARYIAPVYAVLEGLALGTVSRAFNGAIAHEIVLTAIVFTAAVFVGALVLYRTGLVRVTPRMASLAFMGALGILVVAALSFVGLTPPSLGGLGVIFGVLGLGIAVLNLFVDFDYVVKAEAMGISADGEWAAAFAMMTALVLVYVSMLRILAAMYGGRRN
jgi:uncharacterized YccA/Bax inhibitor family protein